MIDPTEAKLAALYAACKDYVAGLGDMPNMPQILEVLSLLHQRTGELERRLRPRDPHPNEAIGYPGLPLHTNDAGETARHLMHWEPKPDMATAIRRAAELSVDHILAWHGQGTSSSMAKSMTDEIERNMLKALNL